MDDPGHPLDIEARIHQVLQIIWKDRWEAIEREACDLLSVKSLRDYFRKPSGFFTDHLKALLQKPPPGSHLLATLHCLR